MCKFKLEQLKEVFAIQQLKHEVMTILYGHKSKEIVHSY